MGCSVSKIDTATTGPKQPDAFGSSSNEGVTIAPLKLITTDDSQRAVAGSPRRLPQPSPCDIPTATENDAHQPDEIDYRFLSLVEAADSRETTPSAEADRGAHVLKNRDKRQKQIPGTPLRSFSTSARRNDDSLRSSSSDQPPMPRTTSRHSSSCIASSVQSNGFVSPRLAQELEGLEPYDEPPPISQFMTLVPGDGPTTQQMWAQLGADVMLLHHAAVNANPPEDESI